MTFCTLLSAETRGTAVNKAKVVVTNNAIFFIFIIFFFLIQINSGYLLLPFSPLEMKKEVNKEFTHFNFHYTVDFLKLAYSFF